MLNRVCLLGRLTADPELRTTPNGTSVTSFTIAVNRSYVKQGAERETDFINIVAWRSTADFVCKYFKKGQLVALEGSIQTRSYTDKEGNKRTAFEVVTDNVYFAEPKRESAPQYNDNSFTPPEPSFSNSDGSDFEDVVGDTDLPF
jgi:single-strand DNA-binding protein